MGRKRRQFTDEFKLEAVRLLFETGRPLEAVARDLDVSPSSLFNWREELGPKVRGDKTVRPVAVSDERAELEMLRRQVRVLEEEREILKKAAAFFAKENTK
jgi:transposase